MVLYLTDSTTPDDIRRAKASGFVHAAKLYPAGATTNSASGVTAIDNIFGVLETMAEVGLRCWCTAKSPAARSTFSIARSTSSTSS